MLSVCEVHRHRQYVAFKRAGCNGGLLNNGFASDKESTLCTETVLLLHRNKGHLQHFRLNLGSLMKVSRDTRTCPPTTSNISMSKVAQQSVPIIFESDQSSFKSLLSGVLTAACGKRCLRRRPSTPTVEVEAEGEVWAIHPSHCCTHAHFVVLVSRLVMRTLHHSPNAFALAQDFPENGSCHRPS